MSKYCEKCKSKILFYDGSLEHEPKEVCECEEIENG